MNEHVAFFGQLKFPDQLFTYPFEPHGLLTRQTHSPTHAYSSRRLWPPAFEYFHGSGMGLKILVVTKHFPDN